MKTVFLAMVIIFLSGCAVTTWRDESWTPPPGAKESDSITVFSWPEAEYRAWYEPKKINSKEEAKANLKNLMNSIYFETMNATDIDVDKYGLRAKLNWTETAYKMAKSDSYNQSYSFQNNIFWGIRNFFGTTTTYQTYQETLEKTKTVIIPFNEVYYISLGANPDGVDSKNIFIYLKNGSEIHVVASNEHDAKLFVDSLYTLSMAAFGNGFENKIGFLKCFDLTDEQKSQLKINGGCFVACVERNSPAWNAGVTPLPILTMFNGTKVTGAQQAVRLILNAPLSGKVKVKFIPFFGKYEPSSQKSITAVIKSQKR